MKVALVKQVLCPMGPWSSVRWNETTPLKLFEFWPGKALYWEMTCLLKADWYVIPNPVREVERILRNRKEGGSPKLTQKHTKNVVPAEKIPLAEYDAVISIDPVLQFPAPSDTLFAYYCDEHRDAEYSRSLRKPLYDYDLFLAHRLDAPENPTRLPQAVAFPYLYHPEAVRSAAVQGEAREEAAWVDWRTLSALGMTTGWDESAVQAAKRLEEALPLPLRYRGFDLPSHLMGSADHPRRENALQCLREIGRCRYYISAGRDSGAGRALCGAASLGCLVIGEVSRPYHRLVCHPACLCNDLADLPDVMKKIVESKSLQEEAAAWQDEALRRCFHKKPVEILEQAVAVKKKQGIPL